MINIIRIIFILTKWKIWSLVLRKYISQALYCIFYILETLIPNSRFKTTLTPAIALVNALQELGPIYIKFGQTLSARPDLIGKEIAEALFILQDSLPPFDTNLVRIDIERELSKSITDLFLDFNPDPVAAASIAQVHKAILKTGETVAVKILRPNIEAEYTKNILALYSISSVASYFLPKKYQRFQATNLIDIFKQSMEIELNLLIEGASCDEIKQNFYNDNTILIPTVYWKYSSKRILTTEWIDGVSIYDKDRINNLAIDSKELSKNLSIMFLNQAYRDGFFHADLHPGNILITKEGKIALIDFGIVGRLSDKDRFAIAEIFHAIFRKDYLEVAKIHIRVGYVPDHTNIFLFAQHCRTFCEPIANLPLKDMSIGLLLERLLTMASEFNMTPQHQLFLLQKTMIVLEGIGKSIYPEINIWQLSEPWITKWAAKNISPEAQLLRAAKKIFSNLINMV